MTYVTSGKLKHSEVKGLLHVDEAWWIDTCLRGYAFSLVGYEGLPFAKMDSSGRLYALHGYVYDGSSGPTDDDGAIDPVPALVHDMLYEAFRSRKLPAFMRKKVDELYRDLLEERGMSPWLQPHRPDSWWKVWQYWRVLNPGYKLRYHGLRLVGGAAASPTRGPQYQKRTAA